MPVISFQDALSQTEDVKRHLLIGNGFSISLFPNRFRYDSLLESADFTAHPEAREAFDLLHTSDFEVVINALRQAVTLLPLYASDTAAQTLMGEHAEALKELLVQAIAGRHPERPSDVKDRQYCACRKFLAHFAGDHRIAAKDLRGNIYSLNYDLLLYWTLLHNVFYLPDPNSPFGFAEETVETIDHDDGFRAPDDDPAAEYVTWDAEAGRGQNVHYLHGALHLFDHGYELQKKCWERSGGNPLIDQIRTALDENRFPLFVAEGHSSGKLARIRHSAYLHKGLRSFRANCDVKKIALFIFGHSLAANDAHVLKQIEKGRCERLFISLYGDTANETNQGVIARAGQLLAARSQHNPLEIHFYDAGSAHVWEE